MYIINKICGTFRMFCENKKEFYRVFLLKLFKVLSTRPYTKFEASELVLETLFPIRCKHFVYSLLERCRRIFRPGNCIPFPLILLNCYFPKKREVTWCYIAAIQGVPSFEHSFRVVRNIQTIDWRLLQIRISYHGNILPRPASEHR